MRVMDFSKSDFNNDVLIIENQAYVISKIQARFKYIPIYDMIVNDIRKSNYDELHNFGISHFDFSADKDIILESWNKIKHKFTFALMK